MFRTHTCGELRANHVGQTVTLCGWVDTYRDHQGVLFVDLRDRYGKTQVVVSPESGAENLELAKTIRCEWVLQVTGRIAKRPEGAANTKLATGEIELRVEKLTVLNRAATPPFLPTAQDLPGEDLRLKYRYLDLRRPEDATNLDVAAPHHQRRCAITSTSTVLWISKHRSSGAARRKGPAITWCPAGFSTAAFYALPQSPQLYKQILMVAGYDRYVQVARCFRDEDLRADRQPEFTQLDVEMSFVEADDVIGIIDGLVAKLAKDLLGLEVKLPLPRMTYDEAMERFGHDAPDLRFGLEIVDITDLAREAEFRVFRGAADSGQRVRGINAKGAAAKYSRKDIDEMTASICQVSGAKGLAWFKVEEGGTLNSPIAKNFAAPLLEKIAQKMQAKPGDFLLFVADSFEVSCKALHNLRKRLGEELKLYDPKTMNFSWIVEFPMFAWGEEEKCWASMHHPFTAPRPQDVPLLKTDQGKCRAVAYDLVINGSEAGGGTIRIHDQELQQQVFELLGIDRQQARERFGFLLDALQFGAPPHGGIALGIDRFVMLFGGLDNIRDCIAFPKTQKAADLMTEAPNSVDARQIKELGIKIVD